MRHHQNETAFGKATENGTDFLRVRLVEIPRRLVRENDARTAHEGAGDGDTLFLPARETVDRTVSVVREIHGGECLADARPLFFFGEGEGLHAEVDVIGDAVFGEQIIILEDVGKGAVPLCLHAAGAVPIGFGVVDGDASAVERVDAAEDIQKTGFSATGDAENTDETGVGQLEVDAAENAVFVPRALVVGFIESFCTDHAVTSSSV